MYETLFKLRISKAQRKQEWDSGKLVGNWAAMFPELFDELDTKTAINQAFRGLKFVDWLSAITVYQCLGYLSLVEGYEFKNHTRKQQIAKTFLPSEVWELVQSPIGVRNAQGPDLLCYAPDYSDWFFCEVKGPGDKLSEKQDQYFRRLFEASNQKSIKIIKLEWN